MVGKTALCVRFVNDRFDDSYEPTYENSFAKMAHYKGCDLECLIKDTQGLSDQEIFRNEYGLGYHGYVLVYSVTSARSFDIIQHINTKLINLIGSNNVPRVLVANKCDLSPHSLRQVSIEQGTALAEEWGCAFVECSAKLNLNVDKVFTSLLDEIDMAQEPEVAFGSTMCFDLFGCCRSCCGDSGDGSSNSGSSSSSSSSSNSSGSSNGSGSSLGNNGHGNLGGGPGMSNGILGSNGHPNGSLLLNGFDRNDFLFNGNLVGNGNRVIDSQYHHLHPHHPHPSPRHHHPGMGGGFRSHLHWFDHHPLLLERLTLFSIYSTFILGILALIIGITLGLHSSPSSSPSSSSSSPSPPTSPSTSSTSSTDLQEQHELLSYVLFGLGLLVTLISLIGILGIRNQSNEFLRVYEISLAFVFLCELIVWILIYEDIGNVYGDKYTIRAALCISFGLVIQALAVTIVYCYSNLVAAVQQQFLPPPYMAPTYHSMYE